MTGEREGAPDAHYLLGHGESELRRLELQGRLYREITTRALTDGGLEPGMRVLDIGCGSGDVTFAAAELVGPEGSVVGVDRSSEGIAFAARRADEKGHTNVTFRVADIAAFSDPDPFDACVGRFVLMHQRDPAASLGAACRLLRPGASVVMIETFIDMLRSGPHSVPHSPLYDRVVAWKSRVVEGAGVDLEAGPQLRRTFLAAGLVACRTRLEAPLEGGPSSLYYGYLAESMRSMLPEAERRGIEGFTEEDAASLEDRLRDEVVASGGVLVVWPVVVARGRTPS